ncbi:MAG: helix-turn-helix domain-containing protein [Actinomycetota bacterium]|nr:helix-turn-helix domain-containing protein [Actinomycetota bacterium]
MEVGVRTNGTLQQRQLARRLRRLREEAGLTLEEAAPKLDWSTSKLGRIETAQQGVDVHGVRSMLDLYDVGGDHWTETIELVRAARQKGWWHAYGIRDQGYVGLEADATVVHDYQLAYVPGLLQIEDYMRALFRSSRRRPTEAEVDRDVAVRLRRQRRLTEEPALDLVAIVDESALHRPVGSVEVMRAQLRHLVAATELPSVILQVLPTSLGVHAGMDGSFTVLGFGEPDEPEIAYVEHTASALHLDKEAEVTACSLVFNRLRSEALSPPDSAALVVAARARREGLDMLRTVPRMCRPAWWSLLPTRRTPTPSAAHRHGPDLAPLPAGRAGQLGNQ